MADASSWEGEGTNGAQTEREGEREDLGVIWADQEVVPTGYSVPVGEIGGEMLESGVSCHHWGDANRSKKSPPPRRIVPCSTRQQKPSAVTFRSRIDGYKDERHVD